jgi:hypothetical protein
LLPLNLYARVRFSLLPIARETAGAARTRHSLLPLIGGSGKLIAKLGRMAPRDREVVFADKLFEIRILQHLLRMRAQPQAVSTGLDPAIHVLLALARQRPGWPVKPDHDE